MLLIGLVVVIVLALALAGYAFVRTRPSPVAVPTPSTTAVGPSGSPSAATLTLPQQFDTFQRDDRSKVDTPINAGSDVATASAYYDVNGVRQVLMVAADPVYDLELFLLSVGLSDISAVGDGFCGDYSGVEMCAVLTEQLAVGVVGLNGQGRADLVGIAQRARSAF